MKNTKYLFDERRTSEGMVSVSQMQVFMSCRKKWAYSYIENLKPRIERAYLTIGKLCHAGMQTAFRYQWEHEKEPGYRVEDALSAALTAIDMEHGAYMEITPMLDEEIPDIMAIKDDARKVFEQAFWEFDLQKYDVCTVVRDGVKEPALELHFLVPFPPSKGLHGYIDAVLQDRETGHIWSVDYKFRKSLSPDEDEAYNIQNSMYVYACRKMGFNITGTMTWQHLNTPAADPAVLKDGKISRAKIKTTWRHFAEFCRDHGQNPEDYREEMEEKLSGIEWCRATYEYRNKETIDKILLESAKPVTKEIVKARTSKANNYRSIYPWNCKMCQYIDVCQAELRGYDSGYIRSRNYTRYTHAVTDSATK